MQSRIDAAGRCGAHVARAWVALACFALLCALSPAAWAAQERMPPDAIASGGCDWVGCAVGIVDEDPDGPGIDWATAADNNSNHNGHFSFGTPTQPLTSGANLQEFRASVRKNSTCGTGTPTARIELWESGALVRAGTAVSVTAANSCTQGTNCQVLSFTWSASEVTAAANVEVNVFGIKSGGSPAARCAVDLGAVEWNADVTAAGPTLPTLSAPTSPFATIDTGAATLGATIDSNGGGTITAYGTVWDTVPTPTGNAAAAGTNNPAMPYGFSHGRTIAQTPGTLIYFRGYADNGAGRGYSPDGAFYLEPDAPTPGVSFSNVTDTSMRISWTLPGTGAGDGSIVVMKQGPAVDSGPVDGVAHVANSSFGSGAQLGTGNYVVFRASGTQVDVTGLAASTSYAVAVYTYAGPTAPLINYQQDSPATGTQATNATPAVATLSSPTSPFATIDTGSATLGATIDNDNGDPVTTYGTVWGTAASPTGNALAAGSSPGSIPPALPFSHARTITQTPGTRIYFRGYADNGAGRGYSSDGSFYLEPDGPTPGVSFSNVTDTSMRISWTLPGTGANGKLRGLPGVGHAGGRHGPRGQHELRSRRLHLRGPDGSVDQLSARQSGDRQPDDDGRFRARDAFDSNEPVRDDRHRQRHARRGDRQRQRRPGHDLRDRLGNGRVSDGQRAGRGEQPGFDSTGLAVLACPRDHTDARHADLLPRFCRQWLRARVLA
jgi:hypothetical protein